MPTGLAYSCAGGPLGTVMLPSTWTDRGEAPPARCLTYEGLVDLAATIAALRVH